MDIKEFAQKVKKKYPAYEQVDDHELTKRILAKYPEYKETVEFEPTIIDVPSIKPKLSVMPPSTGQSLKSQLSVQKPELKKELDIKTQAIVDSTADYRKALLKGDTQKAKSIEDIFKAHDIPMQSLQEVEQKIDQNKQNKRNIQIYKEVYQKAKQLHRKYGGDFKKWYKQAELMFKGEKPIKEPTYARVLPVGGAKLIKGGTLGAVDISEEMDLEPRNTAEQISAFTGEMLGGVKTARSVAGKLGKLKKISKIKNLAAKFAAIRGGTALTTGGGRNFISYLKGDQSLGNALKNTGINIGATLFGMIPENLVKPGIVNLVSQVGGDVAFDVVTDLARGNVTLKQLKKPRYWADKGINNAAGVFFAWDDYMNRKGGFKAQQKGIKKGIVDIIEGVKSKFKKAPEIEAPYTQDIKAREQGKIKIISKEVVKSTSKMDGRETQLLKKLDIAQNKVSDAIDKHGFGGISEKEQHPELVKATRDRQKIFNEVYNELNPERPIGTRVIKNGKTWTLENAQFDTSQSVDTLRRGISTGRSYKPLLDIVDEKGNRFPVGVPEFNKLPIPIKDSNKSLKNLYNIDIEEKAPQVFDKAKIEQVKNEIHPELSLKKKEYMRLKEKYPQKTEEDILERVNDVIESKRDDIYDAGEGMKEQKILDRKYEKGILEETIKKASETKLPVTAVAVDFDNLSGLNNYFKAHRKADPILSDVIKKVSDKLSDKGYMIRTGGDEFTAVLVGVKEAEAQKLMLEAEQEVIQYAKEKGLDKIHHPKRHKNTGIGISYGVKEYDQNKHQTYKDLVNEADGKADDYKKNKLIGGEEHVLRSKSKEIGIRERRGDDYRPSNQESGKVETVPDKHGAGTGLTQKDTGRGEDQIKLGDGDSDLYSGGTGKGKLKFNLAHLKHDLNNKKIDRKTYDLAMQQLEKNPAAEYKNILSNIKSKASDKESSSLGIIPKESLKVSSALDIINKELKGIKKQTGKLFGSAGTFEESATKISLKKHLAEDAQYKDQAWETSKKTRDMWQKSFTKEQAIDFIDMIEKGDISPKAMLKITDDYRTSVELHKLAKNYRERLDISHDIDQNYNDKVAYIENYFPHIWKNKAGAEKFFSGYSKKIGKPGFMKHRTIDFIKDGLKYGLELKSSNPEELVLMREFATSKYRMQKKFLDEMKEKGLMKWNKGRRKPPEGWRKLDDKVLEIYFKGKEGMTLAGSWVMPEEAANIVNNYLKPSLWSAEGIHGSIFRGMMKAKNTIVPFKLVLSGFHGIETTASTIADTLKFAVIKMGRGDWKGASQYLARVPISPAFDLFQAGKPMKAWYHGAKTEAEKTAIEIMIRGGYRPKMAKEFRPGKWEIFKKALWEKDNLKAAVEFFPAIVDTIAKPLMDWYVPRLKMMRYLRNAEDYLKSHPDASRTEQDKALQQLASNMGNRFGQMIYENLLWNRYIRDIGIACSLSLGWNLGTIRDFGGAAIDTVKLAKAMATGKGKAEITDKMVWVPAYTATIGLIGALTNLAMTGEWPKELLDYFYPRTGRINPDGSAERRIIPAMIKEFFSSREAYRKHGIIGGTVKYASHKLNPAISDLFDLLVTNKDFYGVDIRDKDAPAVKQAEQFAKHLGKMFLPFSWSSYKRGKKIHGKGSIMPFLGFPLAPGHITKSKIQKEIYDIFSKRFGRSKSKKMFEKMEHKRELRNLWRNKKYREANELRRKLIREKIVSPQSIRMIISGASTPPDARVFSMLSEDDQKDLIKKMDKEEIKKYLRYSKRKIRIWYRMIWERKNK